MLAYRLKVYLLLFTLFFIPGLLYAVDCPCEICERPRCYVIEEIGDYADDFGNGHGTVRCTDGTLFTFEYKRSIALFNPATCIGYINGSAYCVGSNSWCEDAEEVVVRYVSVLGGIYMDKYDPFPSAGENCSGLANAVPVSSGAACPSGYKKSITCASVSGYVATGIGTILNYCN